MITLSGCGTQDSTYRLSLLGLEAQSFVHVKTMVEVEFSDAPGGVVRLICMRDPWQKAAWHGPFSANSPLWNPQIKNIVEPEDEDFVMTIDDAADCFSLATISHIKTG